MGQRRPTGTKEEDCEVVNLVRRFEGEDKVCFVAWAVSRQCVRGWTNICCRFVCLCALVIGSDQDVH